jgi:hypothetical protein
MIRVVTIFVFASIVLATGDANAQCLKCDPNTVTLEGSIYSKDFPGPPSYESIRSGDERMRYWILRLNKLICVDADDFGARVGNVREVQLVFMDPSFYQRYREFVRTRARFRVVGSLYHQHTGHHVRKVLITVQKLVPLRS